MPPADAQIELKWREKKTFYFNFYILTITGTRWLESKVQLCKVMSEISTLSLLEPNPLLQNKVPKIC